MHLGRFHATVYDLGAYIRKAKVVDQLEQIASHLDQIQSNPADDMINRYRELVKTLKASADLDDLDLDKPYAQQIIDEMNVRSLFNPEFSKKLDDLTQSSAFSAAATANKIRSFAKNYKLRIDNVLSIDDAFTYFDVEFERVHDGECEIGLLLPREIVGDTLPELSKEFAKFGVLFKEVNELTGASEYNPPIRTISSSWWQFFVELEAAQIVAWIAVTKGIVELWTSILTLKKARQELESKNVAHFVLEALDKDIQEKIDLGVRRVAEELRAKHGKLDDFERANELENGISQGLRHMAKRMAQGGLVQIDVSPPKQTKEERESLDPGIELKAKREMIEIMGTLRTEAIETTKKAALLTSEADDVLLLSNTVSDDVGNLDREGEGAIEVARGESN